MTLIKDIKQLAKDAWWFFVLSGFASIIFGLITIFWPSLTLLTFVYLFGLMIVVVSTIGLSVALSSIGENPVWWLPFTLSVLGVIFGAFLLLNPIALVKIFAFVVAFIVLVKSLIELVFASYARDTEDKITWAAVGVLGLIVGVLVLFNPFGSSLAFIWVFGFYVAISGVITEVYAFRARRRVDKVVKAMKK